MGLLPSASVIVPTYNRKAWLCQTLASLVKQTYPAHKFEVIVVDDGSIDGTSEITGESFPFIFRYFRQTNQGDAEARNLGARHSQAEILIFLDDDIILEPDYLTYILRAQESDYDRIVVGTEFLWLADSNPPSHVLDRHIPLHDEELIRIPFAEVCSNNMSIWREDYFAIGMMQGLDFPGSSIWCDVDFTYRAFRKGFEFLRSPAALCWHRDHIARTLDNRKNRMREAAYRSVSLFRKYPDLIDYLPMFSDKTPINLEKDPIDLIVRKLFRRLGSSRLTLWIIERLERFLQRRSPTSSALERLHRWIIGGQIFRGYRQGMREHGFAKEKE